MGDKEEGAGANVGVGGGVGVSTGRVGVLCGVSGRGGFCKIGALSKSSFSTRIIPTAPCSSLRRILTRHRPAKV